MSLLQHCFTADTKFLTSFLTIAITIVTWCPPYIFFSFLILAQHCLFFLLLIGSSSKGIRRTSIGSKTFIFLNVMKPKFLFLIVLIEPFVRKFGHHTARQNTAQRCKKRTFGWRTSDSKRLCSSSLLKCWIISTCKTFYLHFSFSHLISQTWVKRKALEFVVSRSRASSYPLGFLHLQIIVM